MNFPCTLDPNTKKMLIEMTLFAEFKCLYYATNSYLHWHDEYRCEGEHDCIKKMNNALMQMRLAMNKLKEYVD